MRRLRSIIRWRWSGGAVITVVLAIVVVGMVITIKYWDWLSDGEDSPGPTVRTASLIIGGAVAAVLTLWRSILSERQWQVSQEQVEVAQGQARIAQESLLNQRYERATEMLSSQVPVVRLGGVYALSNLAKDYPEQYHLSVVELLCAFLRNPTEFQNDTAIRLVNDNPNIRPIVREDVQAAFRAVAHRSRDGIEIERKRGYRLDLAKTDLRGMDAGGGGDLSRASLQESDLRHAIFSEMNLSRASLLAAKLDHCYLSRSNLHKADLNIANMSFCSMESVDLTEATVGIEMQAVELSRTNLSNAKLLAPNLEGAVLQNTNLTGANFVAVPGSRREVSSTGAEHNVSFQVLPRLTQRQLDEAVADPNNPPAIPHGTLDIETGEPLVWRGRPICG